MKKKEKKIQNAFNREDDIKWLIEQKQNFAKEIITLGQSFEFFQPIFLSFQFLPLTLQTLGQYYSIKCYLKSKILHISCTALVFYQNSFFLI